MYSTNVLSIQDFHVNLKVKQEKPKTIIHSVYGNIRLSGNLK